MDRFSDKVKIVYLSLVILFAAGVFVYLLDTWGIIRLADYLPFLEEEPPVVEQTEDSERELELERLRKEDERLKDEEIRLKEMQAKLDVDKEAIRKKQEELEEIRKSLALEKQKREDEKAAEADREKMIQEMAGRIYNMRPDDSIAIVAGWSNPDLVEVFLQMERNAEAEGRASIVPFLLTKMPRDRAAVVTSMMMDAEAKKLPDVE